jgi:hypothetical protein
MFTFFGRSRFNDTLLGRVFRPPSNATTQYIRTLQRQDSAIARIEICRLLNDHHGDYCRENFPEFFKEAVTTDDLAEKVFDHLLNFNTTESQFIAQTVIDDECFIDYCNADGDTVLSLAIQRGWWHVVESLIQRIDRADHQDNQGRTAAMYVMYAIDAAGCYRIHPAVRGLLEKSDLTQTDYKGRTALFYCAMRKKAWLPKELSMFNEMFEDIDKSAWYDNDGHTPLTLWMARANACMAQGADHVLDNLALFTDTLSNLARLQHIPITSQNVIDLCTTLTKFFNFDLFNQPVEHLTSQHTIIINSVRSNCFMALRDFINNRSLTPKDAVHVFNTAATFFQAGGILNEQWHTAHEREEQWHAFIKHYHQKYGDDALLERHHIHGDVFLIEQLGPQNVVLLQKILANYSDAQKNNIVASYAKHFRLYGHEYTPEAWQTLLNTSVPAHFVIQEAAICYCKDTPLSGDEIEYFNGHSRSVMFAYNCKSLLQRIVQHRQLDFCKDAAWALFVRDYLSTEAFTQNDPLLSDMIQQASEENINSIWEFLNSKILDSSCVVPLSYLKLLIERTPCLNEHALCVIMHGMRVKDDDASWAVQCLLNNKQLVPALKVASNHSISVKHDNGAIRILFYDASLCGQWLRFSLLTWMTSKMAFKIIMIVASVASFGMLPFMLLAIPALISAILAKTNDASEHKSIKNS